MSLRQLVKSEFYSLQRRIARRRAKPTANRQADRVVVFAMHAINQAHSDMAVSPGRFREQIQSLLDQGYRALAIDGLLDVLSGDKPSPPAFAVTFDDGYESVFTEALPILERLSVPAAVFLTTGFLDGSVSPPWRSSNAALLAEFRGQAEYFRPMSWEQARALAGHRLIRFGSHTVSHPLLGTLPENSMREELTRSRSILADRLGSSRSFLLIRLGYFGMVRIRRSRSGWFPSVAIDARSLQRFPAPGWATAPGEFRVCRSRRTTKARTPSPRLAAGTTGSDRPRAYINPFFPILIKVRTSENENFLPVSRSLVSICEGRPTGFSISGRWIRGDPSQAGRVVSLFVETRQTNRLLPSPGRTCITPLLDII